MGLGSTKEDSESQCNYTSTKPAQTEQLYFTIAELEQLKRLLIPMLNKIQAMQGNPPVIVPGRKRTHN